MANKSPKEKIMEFVSKQIAKEKDKFMSGMKNDLYDWEDYQSHLEVLESENILANQNYEIAVKYLKKKQLYREFQQFLEYYLRDNNEFVDDFEKKYDICIDEFERKPKEEK